MNRTTKRQGQVWVETVLYTLIGLALIGVALAIVTPRITQERGNAVVDQSINALNAIDIKINEALDRGEENVRIVPEFTMREGELFIHAEDDNITMVISGLDTPYSEPGELLQLGRIYAITTEGRRTTSTNLTLSYAGIADLLYDEDPATDPIEPGDTTQKFSASTTPYSFRMRNAGLDNPGGVNTRIVITEISGG